MPFILSSFLMLLLNLLILGVIYWGLNLIISAVPFISDPIKSILFVIVKVICVICAVVWIADWAMAAISGGGGFGSPMFFHYPRHEIR